MLTELTDLMMLYGLRVLGGIALLIVGWLAAGWLARVSERLLGRVSRIDGTLRPFLASLVRYGVLAVTVVAVLQQVGIQAASLIAVLGAAGLAIGLALQGTLSNVAAGVMLLAFRPFRVGDYVTVAGQTGTVRSLSLFTTELATPDNIQIVVPNGQVWGSAVTNYSFHPTRRIDLAFGIGYGDDIDNALALLLAEVEQEPRCLKAPPPQALVDSLGDSAVKLVLRVWCAAADYGTLRADLTKACKRALETEGITLPYPQRELHLRPVAAE